MARRRVIICPGVTIGENTVVGAGSVSPATFRPGSWQSVIPAVCSGPWIETLRQTRARGNGRVPHVRQTCPGVRGAYVAEKEGA